MDPPACRSGIRPSPRLADRLEHHHERIVNAVELGLSNSRLEGINAKIRVIQRRGYGHHHLDNLAASIYLCCAGIRIPLPTQRQGVAHLFEHSHKPYQRVCASWYSAVHAARLPTHRSPPHRP